MQVRRKKDAGKYRKEAGKIQENAGQAVEGGRKIQVMGNCEFCYAREKLRIFDCGLKAEKYRKDAGKCRRILENAGEYWKMQEMCRKRQ